MIKRENKKGAEMTIGTVVVIILALVVLIFLVVGFSSGWNNIWEKILNFGQGEANIATIQQACQFACSSNNVYDYCRDRELVFGKVANFYGYTPTEAQKSSGKLMSNCKEMEIKGLPGTEACSAIAACQKSCKGTSTINKTFVCTGVSQELCTANGCSWA
jgi:hypothetical protein